MKVNRVKLKNQIEEIIAYGVAECEEIDLTTKKIMQQIEPLILSVELLNPNKK